MYLDTSNLEEIRKALETGVIKGITTNPTILLKEKKSRLEQIKAIDNLAESIVFVQLVGITKEELLEDFYKLYEIRKTLKGDLGVKVPVTTDGLFVISKIKKDYPEIKVLATAIYSADQGILATIAGADLLAPYVNRMENNNIDSLNSIEKIRIFIDDRSLNTQILAASFKNTNQVVNALISGAHTATIPYDILVQMTDKDLVKNAVEVFYQDGINLEK